jgi:hypothetical protein
MAELAPFPAYDVLTGAFELVPGGTPLDRRYSDYEKDVGDPTRLEAVKVCEKRDDLLQGSDWTQVADAPVDQAAWAAYRQALRDVPQQDGFPSEVVWPESPTKPD